jgi:hypothetical protein
LNSKTPTRPARLLYLGDVPVANTRAGAIQLFRILTGHPTRDLRIVEGDLSRTRPGEELPGATYDWIHVGNDRWMKSRVKPFYCATVLGLARFRGRRVARKYRGFHADGVLTVAHHFSWLSAAAAAEALHVPLHLIVHDDPFANLVFPPGVGPIAAEAFANVYRRAATRLVVSQAMADHYANKFGVDADVLYPLWPTGDAPFDAPPDRTVPAGQSVAFGYAGSLFSGVYVRMLADLAAVLEPLGHRLVWWTDWTPARIKEAGLDRRNVEVIRPASPGRLVHELRDRADVLFVPLNFDPADRINVEINFPSKLTDYTAAALPILMWAPPYSGAAGWAGENPDAVVLADSPDVSSLRTAAARIASDPIARRSAGAAALSAGRRYFSAEAARKVLAPVLERPLHAER